MTQTEDLTEIERAGRRCGVCHSARGWRQFEVVRPAEREPVVLCGSCRARFGDDPRIPMDNNASERRGRGPAVARKNFYGSGSLWSGRLAAAAFSIFATLSMCRLNPRRWLTWYFERCAAAGGKVPADIQAFLPWNLSDEKKKELRDTGPPEEADTS